MDYKEHRKIVICYNPPKQESNQIETNEFLAWAKSDIKAGEKRGRGNALGNIKKAIHSRIDEIIASTPLVFVISGSKLDGLLPKSNFNFIFS